MFGGPSNSCFPRELGNTYWSTTYSSLWGKRYNPGFRSIRRLFASLLLIPFCQRWWWFYCWYLKSHFCKDLIRNLIKKKKKKKRGTKENSLSYLETDSAATEQKPKGGDWIWEGSSSWNDCRGFSILSSVTQLCALAQYLCGSFCLFVFPFSGKKTVTQIINIIQVFSLPLLL